MMKMKSGWMLSDPAHDVRIMNSPNFSQGDFVTVVARGDQILSAMLSSTDGSGDGGTLVAYCFIDGALARASAEVGDVTDEMAWTHTVYYRSGKPVSDATVAHDLAKKRLVSPPPAPTARCKSRFTRAQTSYRLYGFQVGTRRYTFPREIGPTVASATVPARGTPASLR